MHKCKYLVVAVYVAVLSGFTQALAACYTELYVFGGKLEEIGNNPDLRTEEGLCWPGRLTNGETYVELVAKSLEVPLLASSEGGTNYAWGPTNDAVVCCDDRTVKEQVKIYLAGLGESGTADALYLVNGNLRGSFDLTDDAEREQWAKEDAETTLSLVKLLAQKGAI